MRQEMRQRPDFGVRRAVYGRVHAGVHTRSLAVAIGRERSGKIVLALLGEARHVLLPVELVAMAARASLALREARAALEELRVAFFPAAKRLPGAVVRGDVLQIAVLPALQHAGHLRHVAQPFAQEYQLQHQILLLLAGERGRAGEGRASRRAMAGVARGNPGAAARRIAPGLGIGGA